MLRCSASFVIAAYVKYASQGAGLNLSPFARLACGAFYEAVEMDLFFDFLRGRQK